MSYNDRRTLCVKNFWAFLSLRAWKANVSLSWAFYMLQTRHDIEEMTVAASGELAED